MGWVKKAAVAVLILWALASLSFYLYRRGVRLGSPPNRIPPKPHLKQVDDESALAVVESLFDPPKPETQGKIAEREALEDEEYFKRMDAELTGQGIVHERYLMMFPAFGPNNQYLATSELMIWAKTLRRTVVLPNYIAHKKLGSDSIRPFNMTFDEAPFHEWTKTITLDEFKEVCPQIEVATYLHEPGGFWTTSLNNYCTENGLNRPLQEIPTRPQNPNAQYKKPDYYTLEDITKYWSEWNNVTCLALAFPFRHLWGERMERRMFYTARYFDHAQSIKDLAAAAMRDMGAVPGKYLAIHWRDSEEGCYSETPEKHVGYDFCTGAGAYHWGKIPDFVESLKKLIDELGVEVIYLATDSKREDVIDRLRENLPLLVFDDVATLRQIKDNYYLSLVEQELAMQSAFFLGTELSTWSEFIVHWMTGLDKNMSRYANVHWLFEWNKKPYLRHDVWNHVIGKSPGSWQESQRVITYGNKPRYKCNQSKRISSNGRHYDICLNKILSPPEGKRPKCNIISARRHDNDWDLERQLNEQFPHCNIIYLNPDFTGLPDEGLPGKIQFAQVLLDSREYPAPPSDRRNLQTIMKQFKINKVDLLILNLDKREWFVLNRLMRFNELQPRVGQLLLVGNMSPLWDDSKQCHDAECYAYARDFRVQMETMESEHNMRHLFFQDIQGKFKQVTFVNLDDFPRENAIEPA